MEAHRLGKLLFGRPCRLALALWIYEQEERRFFQSEPPKNVITQSAAVKELNGLVQLGMLVEQPPKKRPGRIYYRRTDSPLWKIIEAAAEVVDRD